MAFGRWLRGLVMAVLMTVGLGVAHAQNAPLLVNPGFDDPFVDFGAFGLVAEGWEAWSVESLPTDASPLFGPTMPDLSERVLAGDNAQLISSTLATATAGVFQSATVPENAELVFEVNAYVWSSLDGLNTDVSNATEGVSVEVGIDPLGGIDPLSAGIMWSAPLTTYDAFQAVSVTATAQGTQVTVFVRVMVNTGVYAADVYLDEGILVVAGEQVAPSATEEPIVTVDPAAPTAEQPVATEAPTVEAATAEPTVEAVVTEEALAPTVEAVATEDVAATAEPVVTDAPTVEAVATEVPAVPTAEPTAEQPVATSEPVATEPTEGAPVFLSEIEYVVQDGDNLYSIALVYGSTIEAIAEASGIERETVLFPGDVLTVPIPVPVAVGEPEPLMTDVPTATPEPTTEPTAEATPEATEAAPSGEQTYVVRSGDTLIAIARSFGVNEFELAAFNGFTVVDVIRVGQVLRIPPAEPVEAEEGTGGGGEAEATPEPTPTFRRYVILPGDTLSRIAARYGTSVRALIELNNITNPNRILYGQVIRIPNE